MPQKLEGITWQGESIDDVEILPELAPDLLNLLTETNGFILHHGALHVRGASLSPDWHSLRAVWRGPNALHVLYDSVLASDIPFAQDQLGDQFLIRDGAILRLSAEDGEIAAFSKSLHDFFNNVNENIGEALNVSLKYQMQPGQLLLAYPPFIFKESGAGTSLKPVHAEEVTLFHAELARQIRDLPDGGKISFKFTE